MNKEDLYTDPDFITEGIQLDLYNKLIEYMQEKQINQSELAKMLGVTKGYVSQLLNGNFDFRLGTLVNLCIQIGVVPELILRNIDEVKNEINKNGKFLENPITQWKIFKKPHNTIEGPNDEMMYLLKKDELQILQFFA